MIVFATNQSVTLVPKVFLGSVAIQLKIWVNQKKFQQIGKFGESCAIDKDQEKPQHTMLHNIKSK